MKFSLVLATINRTLELVRFLESLKVQTYKNFELIVVDQNPDDRLVPILRSYREFFPIQHLRSKKGLSKARNVGLRHITGDVVAFPDDDCWYTPDLLLEVWRIFDEHLQFAGITGRILDDMGAPSVGRWKSTSGEIAPINVWNCSTSGSLFLKRELVDRVGDFDETLGAGAGTPWGAAEDIDYPLRAIHLGFRLWYEYSLAVNHPQVLNSYGIADVKRVQGYAQGMGRVLRKHHYPLHQVLYHWMRPLGGIFLSLAKGNLQKARYHRAIFVGRVKGWLAPL